MTNVNARPFMIIIAALSVLSFLVITYFTGNTISDFGKALKTIPTVATIDGIAYFIFIKYVWKWKCLQSWLVPFPDLNGTWQGHLTTSRHEGSDSHSVTIPVILCIRQDFSKISCVMRSKEMTSHSYAEGFWLDTENQIMRLCYTYTSRPLSTLRERSTPHDGTARLEIILSSKKLIGEYWTQRKSIGLIDLDYREKRRLDTLPNDLSIQEKEISCLVDNEA